MIRSLSDVHAVIKVALEVKIICVHAGGKKEYYNHYSKHTHGHAHTHTQGVRNSSSFLSPQKVNMHWIRLQKISEKILALKILPAMLEKAFKNIQACTRCCQGNNLWLMHSARVFQLQH